MTAIEKATLKKALKRRLDTYCSMERRRTERRTMERRSAERRAK